MTREPVRRPDRVDTFPGASALVGIWACAVLALLVLYATGGLR